LLFVPPPLLVDWSQCCSQVEQRALVSDELFRPAALPSFSEESSCRTNFCRRSIRMSAAVAPFPRQLAWYCAAVFVVAMGFVGVLLAYQGLPPLGPLVLFSALAVFAGHRGVVVPSKNISFIPITLVFMAAIVAFDDLGALGGATIVALVAGVYIPALHRRTWGWILFNGANYTCSVGAACLTYVALHENVTSVLPISLVGLVATALAFIAVNWFLLMMSYVVERHRAPKDVLAELTAQLSDLPFALIGLLVGSIYVALGAAVLLLIIVPILIAREMFAAYMRVKESHDETVHLLIRALETKDNYTAGHAERVATYARYMGEELSFMPARLERLRFAALMHDIGKLVVPNHILNKPGRLTPEEFEQVKMHERVGVQMLSHIDFLQPIVPTVHAEAMHFDPDDLDHPIEPYIVMIADAFDAMTSTRAYRRALTQDIAFEELREKAGLQFHPECVESLIIALDKRGEQHGKGFELQSEFEHAPETGVGSAGLGDLLEIDSGYA
jgi:hypothetical protein